MAQLLIFTSNNFAPRGQDDELEHKEGDVIAVAEDTHVWGAAEVVPPFRVVSKPGTRADYAYLLDRDAGQIRGIFPRSHFGNRRYLLSTALQPQVREKPGRPRKWRVDSGDNIIRKSMERN